MERKKAELDLKEVLDDLKTEIFTSLNCHSFGEIISFDSSVQTARIKIGYKRVIDNKIYNYPVLVDCPVIVLSGGNSGITLPIQSGDTCLVLFCDRDLDNWFESGQITTLNSNRVHDLSDGVALVGIRHKQNVIENYVNDRAKFYYDDTEISLKDKVKFQNANKNLKTLIDSFIDILVGLTTTNCVVGAPVSLAPSVISQLNALKSEFGELLE